MVVEVSGDREGGEVHVRLAHQGLRQYLKEVERLKVLMSEYIGVVKNHTY